MKIKMTLLMVLLGFSTLLGACQSADAPTDPGTTESPPAEEPAAPGTTESPPAEEPAAP
jgi:hypothetical protein